MSLVFPKQLIAAFVIIFFVLISDEIAWKKPDSMIWIGIRTVPITEKSHQKNHQGKCVGFSKGFYHHHI